MSGDPFVTNCHVGPDFVACDPAELGPLVEHLRAGRGAERAEVFPRGTLLPDGRLDLCKQGLGAEGARVVMAAARGNPHVRHLLLGADGLGDEGARAVAGLVAGRGDLRTVFLGCNAITGVGAAAVAGALGGRSEVRGLWLKRNPIGLDGTWAVADLLARNRSLRSLDLVNTDLGPEGVRVVVEGVLRGVAPVERLYLCGNRAGVESAGLLGEMLRRRGPLRHLYLSVNRLGDEGVAALAPALAENRTLRTLSLASNGIGPAGVGRLVEAVRGHPELADLDLGRAASTAVMGEQPNRVGDGAEALAELLLDNPALRRLNLRGAAVTERGAAALAEALAGNRTLTALDLDKAPAGDIRGQVREWLERNRKRVEAPPADPDLVAIRSVYRTAPPGGP